jgi:ribosomal protein L24E
MAEDWEYDFNNPPRVPPPHYCDRCGQKSALPMPVTVSKYVRNDTKDHKFCSRECHDEFYMDRMRNLGL